MKIAPINTNNNFKSKFVPNKNLTLAFDCAEEECSKEFLKSMNKFLTDGKDRTLNLVCEIINANGYSKGTKLFKTYFLENITNKTYRFVDKSKYVTDFIEPNSSIQDKEYAIGEIANALIERFWGNIENSHIDKMSDFEVQKSIKDLREQIFNITK